MLDWLFFLLFGSDRGCGLDPNGQCGKNGG
jgi:hypothetical protein